jgi:hypothetical protein
MRVTKCVGRKRNDPIKQVSRIAANGTRLWIAYAKAGGSKATFVFPPSGNRSCFPLRVITCGRTGASS